jgi:hypothetical protein
MLSSVVQLKHHLTQKWHDAFQYFQPNNNRGRKYNGLFEQIFWKGMYFVWLQLMLITSLIEAYSSSYFHNGYWWKQKQSRTKTTSSECQAHRLEGSELKLAPASGGLSTWSSLRKPWAASSKNNPIGHKSACVQHRSHSQRTHERWNWLDGNASYHLRNQWVCGHKKIVEWNRAIAWMIIVSTVLVIVSTVLVTTLKSSER